MRVRMSIVFPKKTEKACEPPENPACAGTPRITRFRTTPGTSGQACKKAECPLFRWRVLCYTGIGSKPQISRHGQEETE